MFYILFNISHYIVEGYRPTILQIMYIISFFFLYTVIYYIMLEIRLYYIT